MNTEYTYDASIVSDLHKDAYGFRPSEGWWRLWNTMTDAERQVEWDGLLEDSKAAAEADAAREVEAIRRFEALVVRTIANGAKDRTQALDWIINGEPDIGFVEYQHGLPYGYISERQGA